MWNQDISGTSAPPPTDITGLAFALRADFAAVDAAVHPPGRSRWQHRAGPDDPRVRQHRQRLLLRPAEQHVHHIGRPIRVRPASPALPKPVIDASSGRLSYDDLGKQLSFAGVLDAATQAAIDAAITVDTTDGTDNVAAGDGVSFTPASMTNIYPGSALVIDSGAAQETVIVTATTATGFTANTVHAHNGTATPFPITSSPALAAAISSLAAANQQAVGPFFATYPELLPLYEAYVASADPAQAKRTALLASFLPILKLKRKQEQALASITSAAGTDPSFASALLQDPTILHADADADRRRDHRPHGDRESRTVGAVLPRQRPGQPARSAVDSAPVLSYAQTATIGGTVTAGMSCTTTINGRHRVSGPRHRQPPWRRWRATSPPRSTRPRPWIPARRFRSTRSSASVLPASQAPAAATSSHRRPRPVGANSFFTLACDGLGWRHRDVHRRSRAAAAAAAERSPASGAATSPCRRTASTTSTWPRTQERRSPCSSAARPCPVQQAGGLWSNQSPISLVAGALVPDHADRQLDQDHALGQLAEPRPRLGGHPRPVPVPAQPGRPARRHLRALPQGRLPGRGAVADRSRDRLPGNRDELLGQHHRRHHDRPGSRHLHARLDDQHRGRLGAGHRHGSAQETVTVTPATATTFSAVAAKPHDGTSLAVPDRQPAFPDISQGWLNFLSLRQRDRDPGVATAANRRPPRASPAC